jgi:hypothetical protein
LTVLAGVEDKMGKESKRINQNIHVENEEKIRPFNIDK